MPKDSVHRTRTKKRRRARDLRKESHKGNVYLKFTNVQSYQYGI